MRRFRGEVSRLVSLGVNRLSMFLGYSIGPEPGTQRLTGIWAQSGPVVTCSAQLFWFFALP
jgi:hypothetical protein